MHFTLPLYAHTRRLWSLCAVHTHTHTHTHAQTLFQHSKLVRFSLWFQWVAVHPLHLSMIKTRHIAAVVKETLRWELQPARFYWAPYHKTVIWKIQQDVWSSCSDCWRAEAALGKVMTVQVVDITDQFSILNFITPLWNKPECNIFFNSDKKVKSKEEIWRKFTRLYWVDYTDNLEAVPKTF